MSKWAAAISRLEMAPVMMLAEGFERPILTMPVSSDWRVAHCAWR